MTRMTTDVDALSTFLQTGLVTAVVSAAHLRRYPGGAAGARRQLALLVFATLPLLVVGTGLLPPAERQAYELAREKVGVVNADLQEHVAGLRVVQAFRGERARRRALRAAQRRLPPARGCAASG